MKKLKLSYSALAAFKACPMRFKGKYIDGIRREEETDSQRRGTNWHELLEVASMKENDVCVRAYDKHHDDTCPICEGSGILVGDATDAAVRLLKAAYDTEIPGKEIDDLYTERAKLFYSLSAYKWYWKIDEEPAYEVVATEVPFEITVINPETGAPARDAVLVGIIDKIVRLPDGRYAQVEHKSTSKPIDSESTYWEHLRMDTQTTLYPYAMLRMQKEGKLEKCGIKPDDDIATTVLYDVWHVPGIKMKKLSIADTKKFVFAGVYNDEEFEIENASIQMQPGRLLKSGKHGKGKEVVAVDGTVLVDGHVAKIEVSKSGEISIVETEGMYGTRLFANLTNEPEKYFARREIQRSLDEMGRFERQLHSMYQAILMMRRTNGWWTDEFQCAARFRCDFTSYCWHGEEISKDNILEGFKCRKEE